MRFALINPPWHFEGSVYFGCHDEHLPLEFGYARALLEQEGHEVLMLDAALDHLDLDGIRRRVADFAPDFTAVTSAPTYLFWRCPPPELRVPIETFNALGDHAGVRVLVGPHASTTPGSVFDKTGCDIAVLGECEQILPQLATADPATIEGIARRLDDGRVVVQGAPAAADMQALPALHWPDHWIQHHRHHHHRFDDGRRGFGAEMEASRGCPYNCTFCAKENFRDKFRWRPVEAMLEELDGLLAQGAGYIYFVDEIFMPHRALLEALAEREVQFGIQTRIDLWKPEQIELLGRAGCVSIEAGVESISELGRLLINKNCRISTDEIEQRLLLAKQVVPFVQASLIDSQADDPEQVRQWRERLIAGGVWANEPVPMFPYPGSPSYSAIWGAPDDQAWERAVAHYLQEFDRFSDIQDERPLPLTELESA